MQNTYQGHIIERFMPDAKEQLLFHESYKNASWKIGKSQPPTAQQYRVAELIKSGKTPKQVAEKLGIKEAKVDYDMRRVATYTYFYE